MIPNITTPPQDEAEVIVNDGFQTLGWAQVYGNDPSVTAALHRGYYGGRWGGFTVADNDHTFGASTTTYVSVALADGSLNFSTSSTNFNNFASYARVEVVVTDGSGVTGVTDHRGGPRGVHGGSGSGSGGGIQCIAIAVGDETTALTTGAAKVTFRMPYAFTLSAVRASVTTAPTGANLIVDINEGGSTLMTTNKLSIDATERTSTTAATPPGLTDTALADDAEITIDIDQVGSTVAGAGLKVYLIGTTP